MYQFSVGLMICIVYFNKIMNTKITETDIGNGITRVDLPEEPLFNFKDKFYTPFDLDTRKITYHIIKIRNNTARLNLECSGFCIGRIELPLEFLPKLKECKLFPTEFGRSDGTEVENNL